MRFPSFRLRRGNRVRRVSVEVPDDLLRAVEAVASNEGVTTGDALVRLIREGAEHRQRRRDVHRVAAQRRAAVARWAASNKENSFPSAEEAQAAILSSRSLGG
jgi:hypothetical protein